MERNPDIPFTYEYSQPEEYHFSLDSIEMPWQVSLDFKKRLSDGSFSRADLTKMKVLDLCAGCGVLGFELNFHMPDIKDIDFVEVQQAYKSHFDRNKEFALKQSKIGFRPKLALAKSDMPSEDARFEFLNINYDQLLTPGNQGKYDVILCNPPYFFPEQGKLSPSEFKNRCRFFIDSSFENLISVLCHTLKQTGEAFLLLRPLDDHGIDLFAEMRRLIRGKLQCESMNEVRGTYLLKLYR